MPVSNDQRLGSSLFRPEVAAALILFISLDSISRKARVSGITMPVTGMLSMVANGMGVITQTHVSTDQQVQAGQVLFTISSERRLELAQQALTQYQALQNNGYIAAAQTRQKHENVLDITSRIASQQQERVENANRQIVQVVAPQAGQIAALNLPSGSSVKTGQSLASLIPQMATEAGTPLKAHVYAPSRTADFIAPGQTVLIRYAAFPYQKFGLHQAKVIEVSRTPFAPNALPQQLATTILSNA